MSQFVSYAQNFEDVMLWRALGHIEKGFYVDVGANDPFHDSVTHAFYTRDWHGINIEPTNFYYARLCEERERDINLQVAAGAKKEELTFYEIPQTGLSTLVPEIAEQQKKKGWKPIEYQVKVQTLNKILEQYVNNPIHFLKIDVEGAEGIVLQGLNLERWRPWVIVLESTTDASNLPGYDFVYFDGLNGFFVSQEQTHLAEKLRTPPNVFDNFISVRLHNALLELEQKTKEVAVLKDELEAGKNVVPTLKYDTEIDVKETKLQKVIRKLLGKTV